MLAPDRHRRILELVAARGSARTTEVARALNVTDETVRRDFEKLEADGQLVRAHGGAVRSEANRRDLPFTSREATNVDAKRAIAARASTLIEPGETIFLDASSTTLELARLLPDLALTVLTNALKIAVELASRPAIQLVLVGGTVNGRSLSTIGALGEYALECHHIQKMFFSCRGVDVARGLSESNEDQARLKRKALAFSDRAILLADHSKLELRSSFFFARANEIDVLITERAPVAKTGRALQSAGIELQIASTRKSRTSP